MWADIMTHEMRKECQFKTEDEVLGEVIRNV